MVIIQIRQIWVACRGRTLGYHYFLSGVHCKIRVQTVYRTQNTGRVSRPVLTYTVSDTLLKKVLQPGGCWLVRVCRLTVSAVAVTQPSLRALLLASHAGTHGVWNPGRWGENCNKGEITAIRIFTVSQKGSHSVQKLKLVFTYLPVVLHLILPNTRK